MSETQSIKPEPHRQVVKAICLAIQFKDFGNASPSGEEWVCTGHQLDLLNEACVEAADAVLALPVLSSAQLLYTALESLLNWLPPIGNAPQLQAVVGRADAALARARGEE